MFLDVKMAHDDFSISEEYYTPVTCFLTFNFCAVLGNLIPNLLTFVSAILIFIKYLKIFLISNGFGYPKQAEKWVDGKI